MSFPWARSFIGTLVARGVLVGFYRLFAVMATPSACSDGESMRSAPVETLSSLSVIDIEVTLLRGAHTLPMSIFFMRATEKFLTVPI